jgi:hypothetical protein
MTFSIYALLGEEAPVITVESLASDLRTYFRNEENFSLQLEQLPFSRMMTIDLNWGEWLVRVNYEEGFDVADDSAVIGKILGSVAPRDLCRITRRIRVVFGDDDTQEYTNQSIYILDFLRAIPGSVLFDPQQRDLVK